jgi:serine/threonine protein kinase
MSLCINPNCEQPDHAGNDGSRFCQSCGSDLVLQDRYRVMRLLNNKSGFGQVYEAYERSSPKVLKVLKDAHNQNPKAVQLFEQEAWVLSHLHTTGVPHVDAEGYFKFYPRNATEPLHCLVMEKIDGPNLKEWMRQQGNHPISEKQAILSPKTLCCDRTGS